MQVTPFLVQVTSLTTFKEATLMMTKICKW